MFKYTINFLNKNPLNCYNVTYLRHNLKGDFIFTTCITTVRKDQLNFDADSEKMDPDPGHE